MPTGGWCVESTPGPTGARRRDPPPATRPSCFAAREYARLNAGAARPAQLFPDDDAQKSDAPAETRAPELPS